MKRIKRYISIYIGSTFILFGFALVVNYIVDPYRIFWPGNIEKWMVKPKAQTQIFFNTAVGIRKIRLKTLLLGNSYIQWGMSAGSNAWPKEMQPVYNAAIPGSNLTTSLAYLKYAFELRRIDTVVLGLDYFSFLVSEDTIPDKLIIRGDYKKFLHKKQTNPLLLQEYAKRLGSLDSLIDAGVTVLSQNNSESMDVLSNGDNPVSEYKKYVRQKGHFKLFEDKLNQWLAFLTRKTVVFLNTTDSSPELMALKEILEFCSNNEIKLVMFIHPYHHSLVNMINETGRAEEYQRWIDRITYIVEGKHSVQLWDFSKNNWYTNEIVPEDGDHTTKMQWYWEPGHYKNTLGNIIIKRVFRDQSGVGRLLYHDTKPLLESSQ